jgi:NADP-dependent 3-hydroxyisobutyrate dehydrogenase-like protein
MRNNGSNSSTLDMKLPMMMEGNFEPHFSVKHMLKDIVIATRLARAYGMKLGATDASRHGLDEEMRHGRSDDDYSSVVRQYFPAGRSLKSDSQVLNGDDDQTQFAGLDDEASSGAEAISEGAAAGPSVVTAVEAKVDQEHAAATPAHDETENDVSQVEAAHQMGTVTESNAQPTVGLESSDREERSGEAGGVWGGFWRRRTDG